MEEQSGGAGALSLKMARSVMARYGTDQVLWHYEHGLMLQSAYAAGRRYGDAELMDWVRTMYDALIDASGTIKTYKAEDFNLDQINPGKQLFDLYRETGDERYLRAIESLHMQLVHQPRTPSGGFWHKKIYPNQIWLDGLYMQGPFSARWAGEFGSEADFEDIARQFELVYAHTRDEKTGLLYHAWNETCSERWADPRTGRSPHFWGRAMGWYCMAVLDVISLFPNSLSSRRDDLVRIACSLIEPVIAFQDVQSGLWYQVLDQGGREKNYLETSASAMFVCFLYRSAGLAPELAGAALRAAEAGFAGLCSRLSSDTEGHLHLEGICSVAGLGGNPYRDGSYEYYVKEPVVSDDFKGVGPFIFAALEAEGRT